MSPRQALLSTLHLFVVAAFFASGLLFVSFDYLPLLRDQMVENGSVIGMALLVAALILLLGFYALDRGRYLVIQMGAAVDLSLVRQTLEDCFARQFPKKIYLNDLELGKKSRLEIKVTLSPLEDDAREQLFVSAEKELTTLLRERFGYAQPFHLIVKM
jgi:hypothetical protein